MNQPPGYGPNPYGQQQQQQQQQYPQQGYGPQMGGGTPPPVKKKGMSGCLLAFLIVLGLFVVGGAVAGFFIWKYFYKPIAAMAEVVNEGKDAPGTKELRAAGCKEASAMDAEKLYTVVKDFAAQLGADTKDMKDPEAPTIVLCTVKSSKKLTCDEVAETYSEAANPKGKFSVLVQVGSGKSSSQECSSLYDSDGKKLGESKSTMPSMPTGDDSKE